MDPSPVPRAASCASVWFDGSCPLCAREIALMRRLDRSEALSFIDITTAAELPLDRGEMLRRLHVRAPSGQILSGAEAFATMWRAIPVLRPFGVLAQRRPVLQLLERLYGLFLRFRPALQSLVRRLDAKAQGRRARHGG